MARVPPWHRSRLCVAGATGPRYRFLLAQCLLKYCTSRSCFCASARLENVPGSGSSGLRIYLAQIQPKPAPREFADHGITSPFLRAPPRPRVVSPHSHPFSPHSTRKRPYPYAPPHLERPGVLRPGNSAGRSVFRRQPRRRAQFTMLDRRDESRVRYVRVNEKTGREVSGRTSSRGTSTRMTITSSLSRRRLQAGRPQGDQTIEIRDFVDAAARSSTSITSDALYPRPRRGGQKVYARFCAKRSRTFRPGRHRQGGPATRQHLAAVMPEGDALVLNTLRFEDELREPDEFERPRKASKSRQEGTRPRRGADRRHDRQDWKPQAVPRRLPKRRSSK